MQKPNAKQERKRACYPCARAKRKCDGERPCGVGCCCESFQLHKEWLANSAYSYSFLQRCLSKCKTAQCVDVATEGKKQQGHNDRVDAKRPAITPVPQSSPKKHKTSVGNIKSADVMPLEVSEIIHSGISLEKFTPYDYSGTEVGSRYEEYGSVASEGMLSSYYPVDAEVASDELHYDPLYVDSYETAFRDMDYCRSPSRSSLLDDSLGYRNTYVGDKQEEEQQDWSHFSPVLQEECITKEVPEYHEESLGFYTSAADTNCVSTFSNVNGRESVVEVQDDQQEELGCKVSTLISRCLYTTLSASPVPCTRITYDVSTLAPTSIFFNKSCCQFFGLDSKRLKRLMHFSKEMSWLPPDEVEQRVVKAYLRSTCGRSVQIGYKGRYLREVSQIPVRKRNDIESGEIGNSVESVFYKYHVYEASVAIEAECHPESSVISRTVWYMEPRFTGEVITLEENSSVWSSAFNKLKKSLNENTLQRIGYYIDPTHPVGGKLCKTKAAFPRKDRPVFDAISGFTELITYSSGNTNEVLEGVSNQGNKYSIETDPHYLLLRFHDVGGGDTFAPMDRLTSTAAKAGLKIRINSHGGISMPS